MKVLIGLLINGLRLVFVNMHIDEHGMPHEYFPHKHRILSSHLSNNKETHNWQSLPSGNLQSYRHHYQQKTLRQSSGLENPSSKVQLIYQ